MKKQSQFYLQLRPKAKAHQLLKQLQTTQVNHQKQLIKSILQKRKLKLKQLMGLRPQLEQEQMKPLRKDYQQFMTMDYGTKGQPFITEKVKRGLASADRALDLAPNLKTGIPQFLRSITHDVDDRKVLNSKFLQYNRIIDSQSASCRISTLQKLTPINIPNRSSVKMKKTYFHKFLPDSFNFYSPTKQYSTLIPTDRSTLQNSRLKRINSSTLDSSMISQNQQNSMIFQGNKSRLKKMLPEKEKRSRNKTIKTVKSQVIETISFRQNKYINAIQ